MRFRSRLRVAAGQKDNWLQLLRYAVVGASGYVLNLACFTVAVHAAGLDFRIAATIAFLLSATNNFLWHRHWTFRVGHHRTALQAPRFLILSTSMFVLGIAILQALVLLGVPEVPAQATAVLLATPVGFAGNRLWTFRGPLAESTASV